MEALRGVFPDVPVAALRRALEVCDNSVDAASEWILEHDWQDLMAEDAEEDEEGRNESVADEAVNGWAGSVAAGGARVTSGAADEDEEEDGSGAPRPQTVVVSAGTAAGTLLAQERRRDGHGQQRFFGRSAMLGSRFYDSGGEHDGDSDEDEEEEEDEDEDDEDDEDEDEDEDEDDDENAFFDSGDDAFVQSLLPPLAKRVKMSTSSEGKAGGADTDGFWVAFDDIIVNKNLIELLNTALSKLAHSRVVLLNRPSGTIDSTTAAAKLRSVLSRSDTSSNGATESPQGGVASGRISLSLLLNNSSSPPAAISPIESKVSTLPSSGVVGQKRKRIEEVETPKHGFFAHFFPVSDLDMVWRSVMHAHLFNSRFGETIEFHTASSGLFNRRDFDELMHLHSHAATVRTSSLSMSPFASLKCCLILPCAASDEEIFRVGKHLHSLLKLQGSLYYRTLDEPGSSERSSTEGRTERQNSLSDLLGEDGKMTEDSFRRFAKYRIKREESSTTDGVDEAGKQSVDHLLGYQRPRSVDYCLQILKADGWDRQLSS